MKKPIASFIVAVFIALSFAGCVASLGSGSKTTVHQPTLGQQLVDLQKARDSNAITDAEYQAQRAKLLGPK